MQHIPQFYLNAIWRHSQSCFSSESEPNCIRITDRNFKEKKRGETHPKWPNRHSQVTSCHSLHWLLRWPLAPLMPPHIPPDSVFAGNKCPSFTVCWLIYTNYRSLCSSEDHQIVPDESIKSLLSQGISLLWSDQVLVGEHGERQKHKYCTYTHTRSLLFRHHTMHDRNIWHTHSRTHTLRSR